MGVRSRLPSWQRASKAAALAVALQVLAPALRAEVVSLPSPASGAWQPLALRGVERATTYAPVAGDPESVRADSECAASGLVLPLDAVDLSRTPRLRWRWRVLQGLRIEEEQSRGGDDFAARVYAMFRFEREGSSWLERLRRRLARTFYGEAMPGTALSFVWTSRVAPGAVWPSPYAESSRMIALARGSSAGEGAWRDEDVDLVGRYAKAFGRPPPALVSLGIMSDSDNTCQSTTAEYGSFRLLGPGD